MTDKVIRPDEVPVPPVDCDALEDAAKALKDDGANVSQAGQDIKSTWQGLEGIYSAPEADSLFTAINPVATKGDDFDSAATSVAGALSTFAEKVRPIKARLTALKADAEDFQDKIDGDDDWRKDEDKTDELDTLNNDILAATHDYQQAERDCANTITALFGGTTFVATPPGEEGSVGEGEQAHGYTEVLKDVETPWATPQEHDAPWYEDVWDGVKDFGVGIAEDLGSMVGLYGEDGWGVGSGGEWWDNLKNNWGDTLNGLGSLVGLYGENGWGVGSAGEWWGNFSSGWTEFAHAVVPWREWGDRPGYVITQSVLNIGSMFVGGAGVYKGLAKGARKAGGGDADVDTSTNGPDQDLPPDLDSLQRLGGRPGQGSTQDLQNTLDGLDIDGQQIDGLQNALSRAEGFGNDGTPAGGSTPEIDPAMHVRDGPELQPVGGHSFDIQANEEGPESPPTTTPTPTESVPDSPIPEPGQTPPDPGQAPQAPERPMGPPTGSGGEGGPGSGGPPTGGGGGGDRPQVPDGEGDGGKPQDQEQQKPDQEQPEQGREQEQPDAPKREEPDGEGKDAPETSEEPEPTNPTDSDQPQHDPADEKGDQDGQESESVSPVGTRPLPADARSGQILEEIDESRVHRNDENLIDQIDGRPVKNYIRNLMTERGQYMANLAKLEEGPPSQGALGGKGGAVNALVFDKRTGVVAEGINGRREEIITPEDVHPLTGERVEAMRNGGPYQQYHRFTKERISDSEFPHNDHPLRHAEVKAFNVLLNLRGGDANSTITREFRVDAMFTLWTRGPTPANCCANCTRIVDGTDVSVDRNWDPPGTPNQEATIIKGDL